MTDLKEHIWTLQELADIYIPRDNGQYQRSVNALNAIEAAILPTCPVPDPKTQFVVGGGGIAI